MPCVGSQFAGHLHEGQLNNRNLEDAGRQLRCLKSRGRRG
jgi:hypothetical protein